MPNYDQISLRRIETAHPSIRENLRKAFMQASDKLTGEVFLRLAYVTRTFDEQNELYKLGRSILFKNGVRQGIVTWAKAGQSFHNYGLAFDIVLIHKNAPKAEFSTTGDFDADQKADWMEVVEVFKANGFEWGGDWKTKKDLPHFQNTFGRTWSELFNLHTQKEFINGTQFVKLT